MESKKENRTTVNGSEASGGKSKKEKEGTDNESEKRKREERENEENWKKGAEEIRGRRKGVAGS